MAFRRNEPDKLIAKARNILSQVSILAQCIVQVGRLTLQKVKLLRNLRKDRLAALEVEVSMEATEARKRLQRILGTFFIVALLFVSSPDLIIYSR